MSTLRVNEVTDLGGDVPEGVGRILQVVQAVKTDTFTTTSATFTNITGLTATITPTSTNSKILILAQTQAMGTEGSGQGFHIQLNGGNSSNFIGDASSSRVRTVFGSASFITNISFNLYNVAINYLDSPATTSAVTYAVQARRGDGGTVFVNRTEDDPDSGIGPRGASSIILLGVAG